MSCNGHKVEDFGPCRDVGSNPFRLPNLASMVENDISYMQMVERHFVVEARKALNKALFELVEKWPDATRAYFYTTSNHDGYKLGITYHFMEPDCGVYVMPPSGNPMDLHEVDLVAFKKAVADGVIKIG